MRIAFDAKFILQESTGIGNVASNLFTNLQNLNNHKYFLISDNNEKKSFCMQYFSNKNINKSIRKIAYTLWQNTYLPIWIIKNKIDILHTQNYIPPIVKTCTSVITIHDLAFLFYAKTYDHHYLQYIKIMVPIAIRRADHIIAVSNNTKKDLIKMYNIHSEKISVIYNGIQDKFRIIKDKDRLKNTKEKYDLENEFILFVGTLEPRKNISVLIKALKTLKVTYNFPHKLVIAGKKSLDYVNILNLVNKFKLQNDVLILGRIPFDDLIDIYNLAEIFVYPTLYEGFGLPILEAMACGTPVITSNNSSIPEIAGNAAILTKTNNIDDLVKAMNRLINDKTLQSTLITKGLKQSKKFSWQKAAESHIRIYEFLLDKSSNKLNPKRKVA